MRSETRCDILRALYRDRRGVVIILFAFYVFFIFALGLAVLDLMKGHWARSSLWSAVDSAILAAGRSMSSDEWRNVGMAYFNANMDAGSRNGVDVSIAASDFKETMVGFGQRQVTLELTAKINAISAPFNDLAVMEANAAATAVRRSQSVELVMILDNTGSMGETNMKALRDDAKMLVTILSNGATTGHLAYAKVGLVPYSAAVNPGKIAEQLIGGTAKYEPNNPLGWKGCVIERPAPHTLDDTSQIVAKWSQYRWPHGGVDNVYKPDDPSTVRAAYTYGNSSTGPNIGCPTPITPLTTDIEALLRNIDAMRHWSRGGTLSDIGMAWGLRVLSPEEPFAEGTAWTNKNIQKVAVLMTDGDARFFKLTGKAAPNEENRNVLTDYTGYGRLDDYNLVGTKNVDTSTAIIRKNLADLCTTMKGAGIRIYTITFGGLSSETKALYRGCASSPDNYFDAPNTAALTNAFESIGGSLTELSIVK